MQSFVIYKVTKEQQRSVQIVTATGTKTVRRAPAARAATLGESGDGEAARRAAVSSPVPRGYTTRARQHAPSSEPYGKV